jgi:DNA primase large subunit
MFAYRKMVNKQVENEEYEEQRDILDTIEDPHELYDETPINEASVEELDLKAIVKEEKKKIKIVNFKDIKKGSSAGFSLFRLIPYLFLVLGFIALKNNELLNIAIYLPSLLLGIIIGSISGREIFKI